MRVAKTILRAETFNVFRIATANARRYLSSGEVGIRLSPIANPDSSKRKSNPVDIPLLSIAFWALENMYTNIPTTIKTRRI
jgi:hypothetical protein